jgi:hypothetical protein
LNIFRQYFGEHPDDEDTAASIASPMMKIFLFCAPANIRASPITPTIIVPESDFQP